MAVIGWSVMAVPDGFRDEAAVDGAFLDAARLTASSLLFAATPPFTGA